MDSMYRAVLFDMDGILYDSEQAYMKGTLAVMRSLGYTGPEEKLYQVIGTTMDGTYRIMSDLLDGRVGVSEIEEANEAFYRRNPIDFRSIMFDGVGECLKQLKDEGYRLAVCSSSPKETVRSSLEVLDIAKYFEVMISADEVTKAKPDPQIYLEAAEKLHVLPQECAVYEDSRIGIEAGKNAGMTVIARQDLRFGQDQSEADYIVRDIYEMVRTVRNGE